MQRSLHGHQRRVFYENRMSFYRAPTKETTKLPIIYAYLFMHETCITYLFVKCCTLLDFYMNISFVFIYVVHLTY